MMCAKDMMDDDDKMMMCDEACAAEMKACEGDKDNKEEMMRCMREQMAMDTEGKGKCMMCKKKAMEDDEEKEMMSKCKDKCSGEMAPCKDKEGAEMKKCMMMQMKKNPDSECMMCAKDMMDDDDKMMMCDDACAAEMKACEGKKDNKEEMMRCMREQMAMDTEGKCMMCKKKMDKKDDDKDMMCMDDCKAEMTSCMGEKAKGDEAMKKCVFGAAGKAKDQKCMTCIKSKDMDDKDDKKMCQTQCASEMGVCKKASWLP